MLLQASSMTMSGSISRGRKKKWKVPCLTPFWIENSSKSFTGVYMVRGGHLNRKCTITHTLINSEGLVLMKDMRRQLQTGLPNEDVRTNVALNLEGI